MARARIAMGASSAVRLEYRATSSLILYGHSLPWTARSLSLMLAHVARSIVARYTPGYPPGEIRVRRRLASDPSGRLE